MSSDLYDVGNTFHDKEPWLWVVQKEDVFSSDFNEKKDEFRVVILQIANFQVSDSKQFIPVVYNQ